MSVSLKDIATELNISTAAASRALNDRPGVSDELRIKVKETAQRLGYTVASRTASPRDTGEETIVILYGHVGGNIIHSIQRGIDETLRNLGYRILRYVIDPNQEFADERMRREFLEHITANQRIAGIICCYLKLSDVLIDQLYKQNIPVVLMENHTEFGRCVTINQLKASYKATIHLIEQKRKNIGCVLPPEDADHTWQDRLTGYQQALKDKHLPYVPAHIAYADWMDIEQGTIATQKLLNQSPEIDAILYGSDTLAAGGIKTLQDIGKRIPEDVAVIGFDDEPFGTILCPTLASVRQPIQKMATVALSLLLDSIEKDDLSHRAIQLETELILRASAN